MENLLYMKVDEAYKKSKSNILADEIWRYKNPNIPVDVEDKEYLSWRNSLPKFLECAYEANLHDVYVIFEMKTPISNKAMDVVLVGQSKSGKYRVLIVELKQWSRISTDYVKNPNVVYIPEARANRKHPCRQLLLYRKNLRSHHSGIQKYLGSGCKMQFGHIAYLHNFENKDSLVLGEYEKWSKYKDYLFGSGDDEKKRLISNLKYWFVSKSCDDLLAILNDYEAVMGDEGLTGLKKAYANEASLKMMEDQQKITDFVVDRLKRQKEDPHKEMIVISGGAGTGKTIVGIRFILEYVKLFNDGKNDNRAIFCLPKSQTLKALFDASCSVDEEKENEYCCYLHEIGNHQNLVVVDEAHRIMKLEETLDAVYAKGTNMLILLQDDHQMLRPNEEGEYHRFKEYATKRGIQFSPMHTMLELVDEKRCDEKWLLALTKLFYDDRITLDTSVNCVKVFNELKDLELWKNEQAMNSKTKYIFPFCWRWKDGDDFNGDDIVIGDFKKRWNPKDVDEQVIWLNDNNDDRVASIYASQGLDMDNVAFVWWDDLVWDEKTSRWVVNVDKIKDPAFRAIFDSSTKLWKQARWDSKIRKDVIVEDGYTFSQEKINLLIKNTYYVMLSRARNNVGIWFKDEVTKNHVLKVLGL